MNSASSRTSPLSCCPVHRAGRATPLQIAVRLGVVAAAAVLAAGLASVPAGSNENGASAFDILPDAPARLLIEGRYVTKDIPQAKSLLDMAAAQGNKAAKKTLNSLK